MVNLDILGIPAYLTLLGEEPLKKLRPFFDIKFGAVVRKDGMLSFP